MTTKVTVTHEELSHGHKILVERISSNKERQTITTEKLAVLEPGQSVVVHVWGNDAISFREVEENYDELGY
jgi:hypothetical protein